MFLPGHRLSALISPPGIFNLFTTSHWFLSSIVTVPHCNMLYRSILAWGLLMASAMADAAKKKCYSMDGQEVDSLSPCFPDAEHSACCTLNDTQGDICMDSGLCMSTSGWWSTFLYANGCTGTLSLYALQSLQADDCRPDSRS